MALQWPNWSELATFALEAERIGVDSIWSAEGWGFDGATPLAYLAAKTSRIKLGTGILQIGTRTPTNMAHDRHVPVLHVRRPVPAWASGPAAPRSSKDFTASFLTTRYSGRGKPSRS